MEIDVKLNRRLHATALSAGITHAQLKEICAKCNVVFDFINTEQAVKIINWIDQHSRAGDKWIDGNWKRPAVKNIGREDPATTGDKPADEYEWREMRDRQDLEEEKKNRAGKMADDLAKKFDNKKLRMDKVVSIAINKTALAKGWTHYDVLDIAQKEFGTYFNRLSDAQGWYLFYLFEENTKMMARWKDIIKSQEQENGN